MSDYPGRVPLALTAGASHTLSLRWRESGAPVDLTGWVALLQVRRAPGSPLLLSLSEVAGIDLGGESGTVVASFEPSDTSLLPAEARYDLRLESPSGRVVYLVAGPVTVRQPISV
jgi:hypothetical protein